MVEAVEAGFALRLRSGTRRGALGPDNRDAEIREYNPIGPSIELPCMKSLGACEQGGATVMRSWLLVPDLVGNPLITVVYRRFIGSCLNNWPWIVDDRIYFVKRSGFS